MEKEKKLARERAAIILQVCSGALTVTEGAERLGISRKTYYEWEDRALKAMALALENQAPGRPSVPVDAEKEELQGKVQELEKKSRAGLLKGLDRRLKKLQKGVEGSPEAPEVSPEKK